MAQFAVPAAGSSGNPNGRPRGSRNRATLLIEDLLDGRARALTEKDEVDLQMLEGTNPQILADEQMGGPQPTA
jgi:hypothetical protein